MQHIKKIYTSLVSRYGMKKTITAFSLFVIFSTGLLFFLFTKDVQAPVTLTDTTKEVRLASVAVLSESTESLSLLGTVESVNEARLVAEAGGRVTAVHKKLGDMVSAGTIIGTLENSTERATVLQAEGLYEAAKAGSRASIIGTEAATQGYEIAITQALNTYRTAYATDIDVLKNTIDTVFSNPTPQIFGYKLDKGNTQTLNAERKALEDVFVSWKNSLPAISENDAEKLLSLAEENTKRLRTFANTLTTILSDNDVLGKDRESELLVLRTNFARTVQTLDGTLGSISLAQNSLIASKSQKDQANIGTKTGDVSLADAQVRQALGALRFAEANLEKTIVRSPISGTISSLDLKVGSSVSIGNPVASITNTGGLEVITYINESESNYIHIGDEVTLQKEAKGTVTQIASSIDATTKKIEVRIGVSSETAHLLTNGQSVTVTILTKTERDTRAQYIKLPITSFKMTPDGPVVFTVNEQNTLVSHPVVLGAIFGDMIAVNDGVTADMQIVIDARGLRADELVTITE